MSRVESEVQFRDLFDQAGIGMAVGGLHGRILRCNEAFARIVGYTEEELRALDPLRLAHPDDHVRLREIFREFGSGRERHRLERRFLRKDGAVRWGRATVSTVHDHEGNPECVLALLEDVTEQHDADAAMRHAEEVCRSITGSSPDTIMILDLDGRIRFINRTVPGLTVEGVLGTTVFDYLPERHWAAVRACYAKVASTGEEGRYEVDYRAPDGKTINYASRVWPVWREGKVAALTLCATDVTARRQLENQLRHAQKMESIGRLAGGVAHDLNNQLSVIMGSVELARRNMGSREAVESELWRVQAAGERAAALAQQLLALGRKQVMNTQLLGLNTVVANVRDLVGRVIGEDIQLSLRLGRVGHIRVDPLQLEQVILNLVINARDAMPNGGRLVISTEEVSLPAGVACLPAGRYALLRVIDSGIGMDAETLARAFEPFFTTKEAGKGTGLGLAVAHGIIVQSGGHIEAESAPGQGATFRIYLPVAEGTAEEKRPDLPAAARGCETVLLVEDEPEVLEVTRRVLEELGYRVLAASSGDEALARLASTGPVHLLLTDVMMPGMDGQELARRALLARPSLRVAYVSGHAPEGLRRPDGVSPVLLQKPLVLAILAQKLREVLDAPVTAGA